MPPRIKPAKETKEAGEQQAPQEFPLSADEYLAEVKVSAEVAGAFKALVLKEGVTDHKLRSEWARLVDLFRSQPTRLTWSEWLSQQGGN